MSNLSQLILEYQSLSLKDAIDEEDENRRIKSRLNIRNRLINNLKDDTYECCDTIGDRDCPFESTDLNTYLEHEIKCYDLKTNSDTIIEAMESMDILRYALTGSTCKYCNKVFKTKNLLNQHLNRGIKLGCVKTALNKKIQELNANDRLLVLNFIREKICNE